PTQSESLQLTTREGRDGRALVHVEVLLAALFLLRRVRSDALTGECHEIPEIDSVCYLYGPILTRSGQRFPSGPTLLTKLEWPPRVRNSLPLFTSQTLAMWS